MEREVLITGIGGQGVQLAAQVIARAATLEGRYVMLFGVYAGAMRGMNTDATVVIGDEPLESPPLVSHASSAIAMHDQFFPAVARKLRAGATVLVNSATFAERLEDRPWRVLSVPATEVAAEVGSDLAASMVMAGAFSAITELVGIDALLVGMRASIPPYRSQHVATNADAIRAGHDWGRKAA